MEKKITDYEKMLMIYITDMVVKSYSHFSNLGMSKDEFVLILDKCISFMGIDCFFAELSKSKNSNLLNDFFKISLYEKNSSSFLKNISEQFIKREKENSYNQRKSNYSSWKRSSIDREIHAQLCFEYILEEECEYSDFINFLDDLNRNRYYQDVSALRMKEIILGSKNKDTYIADHYPKDLKGMKDFKRGSYHCGYIATGKADKKFIRRMRSEGSGLASLMALKALVEFKDLYSDFDTLLSLFNDSKHQDVVNFLTDYYSKDKIMYLIGNPLADKGKIEKKLMGE
jgi:hypothetical protein